MTFQEAIETRISRRRYIAEPLDAAVADELQAIITECCESTGLDLRFVLNNGKAFNGFTKSYGMFSGVTDYIALIAKKTKHKTIEKLGYYGEAIVLRATMLGLGTCWAGGTFNRKSCPFELAEDEMVVCAIVIGKAAENLNTMEKLVRGMTHRKTKTIEQMYTAEAEPPEWFMDGMRAVQRAPSAANLQPVKFVYTPEFVTASVAKYSDTGAPLDLGIAKLHFELGSGGGKWEFGNNGKFVKAENSYEEKSSS